jgi:hypothetical protein
MIDQNDTEVGAMLKVVCSQRDRFKALTTQLEGVCCAYVCDALATLRDGSALADLA